MQISPSRTLRFTDASTGDVVFACPVPTLGQIEACIRLDLPSPDDLSAETALARHRRYVEQLVALTIAPSEGEAAREARAAFFRALQYPQLVDVYRKLMLAIQGIDFDTLEEFERALFAQKKSGPMSPSSPEPSPSTGSGSSSCASPSTSTPSPR